MNVDIDVPEEERVCSWCGEALVAVGEDASERGHITPAQVVVNRYACRKHACPAGHVVVAARLKASSRV